MLEYDDSGFYYFSLTLLTFILAPPSVSILHQVLSVVVPRKSLSSARTSGERQKEAALRQDAKLLKKPRFMATLLGTILGWALWYYLLSSMSGDLMIASFDPHAILGITEGAPDRAIKKSYRALSLKYHPDKNPGNKMAEDMFLKISRAYEALTVPEAMENWRKYGNPDGKQNMAVSIALPTFLLDKNWHNVILIVYLIVMVVVIPAIVAVWYNRSKKYGEKDVMYASYGWYNHMLTNKSSVQQMPEVFAGSAELREANKPSPEEAQELAQLYALFVKHRAVMPKPRYEKAKGVTKGALMLFAHFTNKELKGKKLIDQQRKMLVMSPGLLEAVIELAWTRRWLTATLNAINFSQYLVQGLWVGDSPLMQLPNIGKAEVTALDNESKGKTSLAQYLKLSSEDQMKNLKDLLSENEMRELKKVISTMPRIDVKVSCYVDDEKEIAEGDMVAIKIELTRQHVPEGGKAKPVFSPRFPAGREEVWRILLGSARGNMIYGSDKITSQARCVSKELRMMAPKKPCTVELDVYIKSDSYIGLDQKHTVRFDVVSASNLPVYKPHPEDVELDNEPTLFEQVMQAYDESDSDEDDEDQDKDGVAKGSKSSGENGTNKQVGDMTTTTPH
eukprot:435261_1